MHVLTDGNGSLLRVAGDHLHRDAAPAQHEHRLLHAGPRRVDDAQHAVEHHVLRARALRHSDHLTVRVYERDVLVLMIVQSQS